VENYSLRHSNFKGASGIFVFFDGDSIKIKAFNRNIVGLNFSTHSKNFTTHFKNFTTHFLIKMQKKTLQHIS
jgi:hypothetical protein